MILIASWSKICKQPTWPTNPGTFHPLDVSFGASSTRWNVGNVFLMICSISWVSEFIQTSKRKNRRIFSPDKRPSYPCSTCSHRKAYTQWSAHQCCWKGNHLILDPNILASVDLIQFCGGNDGLTGSWFSQQNWLSRLRSGRAWPHSSPGHVGDS